MEHPVEVKGIKKILLLGGSGFIGKNLVKQLIEDGYDITVFSRNADTDLYLRKFLPKVHLISGDFAQYDVNQFKQVIEKMDCVIHMISSTNPSNMNVLYEFESSVIPTIKLLNACVEGKIKKLIYISSGGTVYGAPRYIPIDEGHRTEPISAYGIHKLSEEKCIEYYGKTYGLNYIILRLANPFGIGQNPKSNQGAIAVFLAKALTHEQIVIWGDGSATRDYVYIEDVIDACTRLITYCGKARIFNVGSSKGYSINQIIRIIGRELKLLPLLEYKTGRIQDVSANILDIALLKREVEWTPKIQIEEGIHRMVQAWDAKSHEFRIG